MIGFRFRIMVILEVEFGFELSNRNRSLGIWGRVNVLGSNEVKLMYLFRKILFFVFLFNVLCRSSGFVEFGLWNGGLDEVTLRFWNG